MEILETDRDRELAAAERAVALERRARKDAPKGMRLEQVKPDKAGGGMVVYRVVS